MAEPLTEQQNPSTADLDQLDTHELLHRINDQDRRVAWAVEREIDVISAAVDEIGERLTCGGRLHYFGAGTSGRLAVLDAAEIPPTFSAPEDLVVAHIAGGAAALVRAVEAAADDEAAGRAEAAARIGPKDAVVGVSASGSAAYVVGALNAARAQGALTVAITNTNSSPLAESAQIVIRLLTGAEVIAGSTRMKAGSAQKMTLNMLSTAVMVKLGKVHGNLMVDVRATNNKLRARARRLVKTLTGVEDAQAERALADSGYRVKTAVVMLRSGCGREEAERRLLQAGGFLRRVIG